MSDMWPKEFFMFDGDVKPDLVGVEINGVVHVEHASAAIRKSTPAERMQVMLVGIQEALGKLGDPIPPLPWRRRVCLRVRRMLLR